MGKNDEEPPGKPHASDADAMALWQRTVEALVASGASPAEAIDGANLLVQAYQRKRTETPGRRKRAVTERKKRGQ